MRKLFLVLFTACSLGTFAQNSARELDELQRQIEKKQAGTDSISKRNDSLIQQQSRTIDSVYMRSQAEINNNGLNSLVREMKERENNQKKAMWLRIGFGIVLLIVGIIGISRKRKPKN